MAWQAAVVRGGRGRRKERRVVVAGPPVIFVPRANAPSCPTVVMVLLVAL